MHAMQRKENLMMKNSYLVTKLLNINVSKGENNKKPPKK